MIKGKESEYKPLKTKIWYNRSNILLSKLKENCTTLRICYIEGDIENPYEYVKRAYNIDKNDENLLKHIKKLPYFDYNI